MPPPFKVRDYTPCAEERCPTPPRWVTVKGEWFCNEHAISHITVRTAPKPHWRELYQPVALP